MKTINSFLTEEKVGKHKHIPDKEFNRKQLKRGIEVEKEHTDEPKISKEIAKDHLAEIDDYYTRLDKMEREAGVTTESLIYEILSEKIVESDDEELKNLKKSKQKIEDVIEDKYKKPKATFEEPNEDKEHMENLKDAIKNLNQAIGLSTKEIGDE